MNNVTIRLSVGPTDRRRLYLDEHDITFLRDLSGSLLIALALVGIPYFFSDLGGSEWRDGICLLGGAGYIFIRTFLHSAARAYDPIDTEFITTMSHIFVGVLWLLFALMFFHGGIWPANAPSIIVFGGLASMASGLELGGCVTCYSPQPLIFVWDEVILLNAQRLISAKRD